MNGLIRYTPQRNLSLWEDFDRMLNGIFDDVPVWNTRAPLVDVREEEGRYVLEAELPGLTEKDVDVKVEENLLTISSVKNEEKEEKGNGFLMKERRAESFKRSFVLPKDVDKDQIQASFKNGLLTLVISKSPEAKPRTIQVKAE